MRKFKRKIKQFLSEVNAYIVSLFQLIIWLIRHCFYSDFKNHIQRSQQGRAIDIIVNGPSFISQIDNVKNDGFCKCMVNFAANTPEFFELKPEYYCLSDPGCFRQRSSNINMKLLIENLQKVNWDMNFFVTYHDYKSLIKGSDLEELKHIHFIPFHSTVIPFSFKFRKLAFWLFSKGQAMPIPMSVSVPVIMNALNCGYSVIRLFGYDQDWIHNVVVDENNRVCLQDTHFYNESGEYRPWWKNIEHTETFTMYEIMRTQAELFESYWFIREYLEYLGNVKIINMSPVSLIDAFDRE